MMYSFRAANLTRTATNLPTPNRKNRQGGGVALVCKDSLIIKMLNMVQSDTL